MARDPAPYEQIEAAANCLTDNRHVAPKPITRTLREMFGLAFNDACKAMAEAERIHQRASQQR